MNDKTAQPLVGDRSSSCGVEFGCLFSNETKFDLPGPSAASIDGLVRAGALPPAEELLSGFQKTPVETAVSKQAVPSPDSWLGRNTYGGAPRPNGYGNPLQTLDNPSYSVGYDNEFKNPAWVAFRFREPRNGKFEHIKRPDADWQVDDRTSAAVRGSDYSNSGYDRGHMAPSFGIMKSHGPEAQRDTYKMTNIVPQTPELNRHSWKRLEHDIANDWLKKNKELWMISGPIYGDNPAQLESGVRIPESTYMIVLDEHRGKPRALSFIIPQNVDKKADYRQFLTSVDEVEEKAKIDFFHELDDEEETALESHVPDSIWHDKPRKAASA